MMHAICAGTQQVDWNFIIGVEGGYWLRGYVPNRPGKDGHIHSGVTILFGFDLGRHNAKEIKALHLSPALESKLLPYVGKRGPAAVMMLHKQFRALSRRAGETHFTTRRANWNNSPERRHRE